MLFRSNFCYEHGDKGLDYLDAHAPLYSKLYDKYLDDYEEYFDDVLEAICYYENLSVLKRVLKQMQAAAEDCEFEFGNGGYDDLDEADDASDDELFGSEPALSGAKRLIYNAGRKILHSLEQAWRNPAIQREYNEYLDADDSDEIGRAHV